MTELYQTTYPLDDCQVGIVHVGFGAFHRAHQAMYLDDYMEATGDLNWGIGAVNLRAAEADSFAISTSTIGKGYMLKAIAPDGSVNYRTVRSHIAAVDASQDLEAALNLVARPSVKALSMTVTEGGYSFDADWKLNLEAPEIASELAGGPMQTIYAFLAVALARRADLDAPITVLSCDNMRSNGLVLRQAVYAYLAAKGEETLLTWVKANVTFPCSMVDRITPRSTNSLQQEIAEAFPEYSISPIHAEVFHQWVLEDAFATDFPALEKVGVEITNNVEPYEEAKIRILNGGHTGLCYLGALAGHRTFDQAMRDPDLRVHFDAWERNEVLPGLGDHIPFDTTVYLGKIAERFENAGIEDQIERICMDGYSKMPIYIRPTLEACLNSEIDPQAGYDCAASWVVYARKAAAGTAAIPYHEPFQDKLSPLLAHGQEAALASDPQLWGDLPKQFDNFVPGLTAAIKRMEDRWPD